MFSTVQWVMIGLLATWANAFQGSVIHKPHSPVQDPPSRISTICTSEETSYWTTPSIYASDTTVHTSSAIWGSPSMSTSIIPTTPTACFNSTVTTTVIVSIIETQWLTTSLTTTSTVINTTTQIIKDTVTESTTERITDTTTDTTTATTTITQPTTITEAPNPCPTTCSMSVGTVNLFYWPTNQPHHIYPSTYVHSQLNQTFTSPSVYMIVDYLYGYNTAGQAGPSGTSVVFPLDLNQVSTIDITNSATRQLTLNDLGTDCPQTEAPSVIATAAPNGRCDPILVAPEPVKSWALPCNACGNFGLFDPPYAVEPLTGGLVPVTTTVSTLSAAPTSQSTSVSTADTAATAADSTTTVASTTNSTPSSEEMTSSVPGTTSSQTELSSSTVVPTSVSLSTTEAATSPSPSSVSDPATTASVSDAGAATSPSSSSVSSPATTSPAYNSALKKDYIGVSLSLSFCVLAYLL